MCKSGTEGVKEYLMDLGNYADFLYIFGSAAMSLLHYQLNPFHFASKVVMIFVILLSCIRTLKFMRIFRTFSPIVKMLSSVIADLRPFLFFYIILTMLFSLLIGVLEIGNLKADGKFKDTFAGQESGGYPGIEYEKIGLFWGNIASTLKMSTGDFGIITAALYLDAEENIIFWICWVVIVVVTCIVFLNFIIAEAGHSYEAVNAAIDSFIAKDKASLIAEAEDMLPNRFKT